MDTQEKPMQPLWFRFVRMLVVVLFVLFGLSVVCVLVSIAGLTWGEGERNLPCGLLPMSAFFAFLMFACAWPIHRWARDRAKQYRD